MKAAAAHHQIVLITQYWTLLSVMVVLRMYVAIMIIYEAAVSLLISIEFYIFFRPNRLSYYVRYSPTLTLVAFTLAGRLWKHNSIFAIIVQTKELSNPNLSPKMRNCTSGWSYRPTQ